jgi:hypothetical protein
VNGAMKAAWGLTAFAVFIVLGVLTGIGAWLTGRSLPKAPTRPSSEEQKP